MSAPTSMQAGHPITRVAVLASTNAGVVTLVCAGGASVSVQSAPRWSTTAAAAREGGISFNSSHSTSSAASGKGADALWSMVQQWTSQRTSATSQSLPVEQRASVSAGEVTSLCATAVPGTDIAVIVVGTTVGTVALFAVEGSRTLFKIAECSLQRWSGGRITAHDAVVDAAFSMDVAGRPEFVAAATAGCLVLVDVQRFYQREGEEDGEGEDEDAVRGVVGSSSSSSGGGSRARNRASGGAGAGDWAASGLRAKAMEALKGSPHAFRRSRSDVFTCAFAEANVVRLLPPQRLQAAVAMDVALVVVLSDGALHFVERVVEGGSVRLLAEHHQRRLAAGGAFIAYGEGSLTSGAASPVTRDSHLNETSGLGDPDARALPHVIYRYRLSPLHLNVCEAARNGGGGNGFGGAAGPAADVVTVINDAALVFNDKAGVCHLVVAGTQLSPTGRTNSRHASPSTRAAGWWAVVHNAVLPRGTFDRAALERQALQQQQQQQQRGQHDASFSSTGFAPAYNTDAGSPFMIHVQSSVMALPATVGIAAASHHGISSTAAAAAAAAGIDASAGLEGGTLSSAVCSPTGTGAHLAAGPTAAGVGCGFAAAAVVGGAVVLSAGAEVLVGDLRDVFPHTRSLPALRPVRAFGAVLEALASGPFQDGGLVLVATGSRVVPVSLG